MCAWPLRVTSWLSALWQPLAELNASRTRFTASTSHTTKLQTKRLSCSSRFSVRACRSFKVCGQDADPNACKAPCMHATAGLGSASTCSAQEEERQLCAFLHAVFVSGLNINYAQTSPNRGLLSHTGGQLVFLLQHSTTPAPTATSDATELKVLHALTGARPSIPLVF